MACTGDLHTKQTLYYQRFSSSWLELHVREDGLVMRNSLQQQPKYSREHYWKLTTKRERIEGREEGTPIYILGKIQPKRRNMNKRIGINTNRRINKKKCEREDRHEHKRNNQQEGEIWTRGWAWAQTEQMTIIQRSSSHYILAPDMHGSRFSATPFCVNFMQNLKSKGHYGIVSFYIKTLVHGLKIIRRYQTPHVI